MTNLIKNWQWLQGSSDSPSCFTLGDDTTYDSLCVNGCRTCSSTRVAGSSEETIFRYDNLIPNRGCCKLWFGCTARAAECDCCMLVVECVDCAGVVISKERRDVTNCVCGNFRPILDCFRLAKGTKSVRVSLASCGTLSAFTCFAPTACLA